MPGGEQNENILTELIQKQMLVLGPNIALDTARKVAGLKIADDGKVLTLSGDFEFVAKALVHEYVLLSESVTHKTLESLKTKYPQLKGL